MKQGNALDILIIGAGGHAQVVVDILLLDPMNFNVIGYIDDNKMLHGQTFLGIPVLGSTKVLNITPHDGVIVAIGENQLRAEVFAELVGQNENLINAIHPDAVIANDVNLGKGVVICAGVVVNTGVVVHNNAILNTGCSVDHHNVIHAHVHIAPGSILGGDVTVGEGTLVGIGSTVMPQISIGAWSKIGAGALITKNIPDHVTAVGIPADFAIRKS